MMFRCLGCMREYDDSLDICPHCGYVRNTPAKKSNELSPGSVLAGRYIIGRALGNGGFGITYIAWDSKLSKSATIKEYLPGAFAYRVPGQKTVASYDGESAEKFKAGIAKTLEEGNCLARVNSLDGVVDVYNCIEENGTVYIVMEYLEGQTLKEIMEQRGVFSFEEALDLLTPIIVALSEIHETGIIHRDISPDNIFICDNGKVKLIDFGAARVLLGEDQKSLSIVLKRGYAPREQYLGRSNQGSWTDVYATAATMYRLITGKVPPESLEREAQDNLIPPSQLGINISAAAEQAILNGLAVKETERTRTAGEFLRQLNAAVYNPDSIDNEPTKYVEIVKKPPVKSEPEEEKNTGKKKKTIIIASIAAAVLIAIGAIIAFFASDRATVINSGTCGESLNWEFDSEGTLEISGNGKMADYENITEVPWYEHAEEITAVKIDNGVESIGNRAFYACYNVQNVEFGNSLSAINSFAFFGCGSLSEVVLPETLIHLGANAFASCTGLKYLHIPSGVTSFGIGILSGTTSKICTDSATSDACSYAQGNGIACSVCGPEHNVQSGENVSIAPPVSNPDAVANGVCGDLLQWVLDNKGTLTISGAGPMAADWALKEDEESKTVFADGSAPEWTAHKEIIKNIVIEEGVTDISNCAFTGLTALESITVAQSVTSIGNDAFNGCIHLEQIALPENLSFIGERAFSGCASLKTITVPALITSLPAGVFSKCATLMSVTLPDSLSSISEHAFSECKALLTVTVPAGVTNIGEYAFYNCSSLINVSLPSGLTQINKAVFSGCGFVSFDIPSSVELIGDYAFSGCKALKTVSISRSVKAIGQAAFGNCTSLTSVALPSSVTTVGAYAFSDCASLDYVHIPSNVKNIGTGILEDSPAVICTDSLISNATTYATKNGIRFERCTGRH